MKLNGIDIAAKLLLDSMWIASKRVRVGDRGRGSMRAITQKIKSTIKSTVVWEFSTGVNDGFGPDRMISLRSWSTRRAWKTSKWPSSSWHCARMAPGRPIQRRRIQVSVAAKVVSPCVASSVTRRWTPSILTSLLPMNSSGSIPTTGLTAHQFLTFFLFLIVRWGNIPRISTALLPIPPPIVCQIVSHRW